jgi:hypothetical protein
VTAGSALRQLILEANVIADEDLDALEGWPAYVGAGLAERLYRSGVVSDARLCELFVTLGAVDGTAELLAGMPPPSALGALSRLQAERHRAIALRVERARIVVAMLDPSDTDAIEKISFFTGLAVEPRAVRPRVLFHALEEAYGIPALRPDAAFLASREVDAGFAEPPHSDGGADLPTPAPTTPVGAFGALPPAADPSVSPLARSVMQAAGGVFVDDGRPRTALAIELLRDVAPAHSPALPFFDEAALAALTARMPGTPLEARDSLPPQVLRLLVPPLRCAALFLVRDSVAVGWDGRTAGEAGAGECRAAVRDVLLPLTASSSFERACRWRTVAVGNPDDPSTVERTLWRHLGLAPASSFAVVPLVVGARAEALLYIDRPEGILDDAQVGGARRVGNALADGLAPFVAAGTLFPPVPKDGLPPLPSG